MFFVISEVKDTRILIFLIIQVSDEISDFFNFNIN